MSADNTVSINSNNGAKMSNGDDEEAKCPLLSRALLPADRLHMVYIIFYLLGIGSLLPWNFFITAKPYFQYKMRNISSTHPDDQSNLQKLFENYLILASNIPNVLLQFVNVAITKCVSQKVRMVTALFSMIVVFFLTDTLCIVTTDTWQTTFFSLTMLSVVISNAAQSLYCGALFGLAACFPSKYIRAAMTGQAFGGTLSAVANILAIAISPSVEVSALAFFIIATAVIILCLASYLCLSCIQYSRFYLDRHSMALSNTEEIKSDCECSEVEYEMSSAQLMSFKSFLRQIMPYTISIFLVFFVTLSVFPALVSGIISMDKSSGTQLTNRYFSPVVCFLFFNLSDFVGRSITSDLMCIKSYHKITFLVLCSLRVVFVPLSLYCNVANTKLPVVFNSDVYPIVFMVLLGLSNGYLSTLLMMYGPENVSMKWAELTGAILSLALSLGLASGSGISLALVTLATND